ncbi:MAG: hypothetical protein ACYCW6_11965 [Candidatus Xenobia bacterium]
MAEKVLVVEDERDLLDWIRLHLERDGYEVMVAQDGTSALACVDWTKPLKR